jgi:hypothetical protein
MIVMDRPREHLTNEELRGWDFYEQHRQSLLQAHYGWASFALKVAFGVNGAAAVGTLAFIGQIAASNLAVAQPIAVAVIPALQYFLGGIIAACVAAGASYLRDGSAFRNSINSWDMPQILAGKKDLPHRPIRKATSDAWMWVAIICWGMAIGLFAAGSYEGSHALRRGLTAAV